MFLTVTITPSQGEIAIQGDSTPQISLEKKSHHHDFQCQSDFLKQQYYKYLFFLRRSRKISIQKLIKRVR